MATIQAAVQTIHGQAAGGKQVQSKTVEVQYQVWVLTNDATFIQGLKQSYSAAANY